MFLACLAKAESAQDKSWRNLKHTIKESRYTVAIRDGRCITGHIKSFDMKSVTIDASKLNRNDVLRIGDGESIADHDPIYSGRSSWSDLQRSEPNKYEHIHLELKKGVRRSCRSFGGTKEEEALCDGSPIGRLEVVRGYYVRLAPSSDWEHYVVREGVAFLAPRTWFSLALFPRIMVLLYDETAPQENLKVECKTP